MAGLGGFKLPVFPHKFSAEDEQEITSHSFVAFSMNFNHNHWMLCLILYLGNLTLDTSTHRTAFIILDSDGQQYPSINWPLCKLLGHIMELQGGPSIKSAVLDVLPIVYPEVGRGL